MNGRIQRWQLLLRLLLSLGLGWALWRAGSPWSGMLLAALVFWSHALLMLIVFIALPWVNKDQGARASHVGMFKAWAAELLACERVFAWQQPFAEQQEPDFLPPGNQSCAVLLLHGFTCNRGLWNPWLKRLRQAGHPFIALTLEPAFGSIDDYAAQIEGALRRLEALGGPPPFIVAHSMGGLAARSWCRRYGSTGYAAGANRLGRVITLGSPHAGTAMAKLGVGVNAGQMRQGSAWLQALRQQETRGLARQVDCYFSRFDQIVCPASSAVLPGARAIEVPACGHLDLVFQSRIIAVVLAQLAASDAERTELAAASLAA